MKKVCIKTMILLPLVFLVTMIISTYGIVQSAPTEDEVTAKLKDYITKQFNTILVNKSIEISDIAIYPDRDKSNNDETFYNVNGVVKNLELEDRTLASARLSFTYVLNTKDSTVNENTTKIVVIEDDGLTSTKQELMINENINKVYGEPLYVSHENDNSIFYGADVTTTVKSTITLEKYIVYTETHLAYHEKTEKEYPTFIVKTGSWDLQDMKEVWKAEIPNETNIIKNKQLNNIIFSYLSYEINKNEGKMNFIKNVLFVNLSKTENVSKVEPIEANGQECNFSIKLSYKMFRSDFWNGNKRFLVDLNVILRYDQVKNVWVYYSNADIMNTQIVNSPDQSLLEKIAVPAIAVILVILFLVFIFLIRIMYKDRSRHRSRGRSRGRFKGRYKDSVKDSYKDSVKDSIKDNEKSIYKG